MTTFEQEPDDRDLRDAARRLGARAAERLDVDGAAARVVARLQDERRAASRILGLPARAWRIAAAIVVIAGAGAMWRARSRGAADVAVTIAPPTSELDQLSADQLQELLPAVDAPDEGDAPTTVTGALQSLSADELERLLGSLEG